MGTAGKVPMTLLTCSLKVATPPPSGYAPGPAVMTQGAVLQFWALCVASVPFVCASMAGAQTASDKAEMVKRAVRAMGVFTSAWQSLG